MHYALSCLETGIDISDDDLPLFNLFVTFSGYWPERGVRMPTGTFKECEAYSVCARIPATCREILVGASAGNTARAFCRVCSANGIPLVVVIPERNLPALWSIGALGETVRVIAAGGDCDYADAINLAETIAALPGFTAEGGARNVARRDGMATTVLSAVDTMKQIPMHYFQAVGRGTGAIAAWEANLRLLETGAYGERKTRLHVSQNNPFTPIHDSWQRRTRDLVPITEEDARIRTAMIGAKVLANRNPPYAIRGGLYDALTDTNGTTGVVDNTTADAAASLFLRREGIDIDPAAAVAVAHLVSAAHEGLVGRVDPIMLNITGGGYARIRNHEDVRTVSPDRVIDRDRFSREGVARITADLFAGEHGPAHPVAGYQAPAGLL